MPDTSQTGPVVTFRFYGALNDFLPPHWRQRNITVTCQVHQTVKDAIEALGVPHPEIQLILINGQPAGFDAGLSPGNHVSVYPFYQRIDISSLELANDRPYEQLKFILDVHLGKLAKFLRFAGFDAILLPFLEDHEIVSEAIRQDRIILTRDIGLLKIRDVRYGYWLRSQHPEKQFLEVIHQFQIKRSDFAPWERCSICNNVIKPIGKYAVEGLLKPGTRKHFQEFYQCQNCGKVYWKGSHFERLNTWLQKIMDSIPDQ